MGHRIYLVLLILPVAAAQQYYTERWPLRDIWAWYVGIGWRVGPNYIPNAAVNAIQMWQGNHFDPVAINRELSWAARARMNTVRVFLHYIPWAEDRRGFLGRVEDFLTVAAGNGLKVAFVLLDDTWQPFPKYGEQPEPIPLVHNSQWVQNPGWKGLLNNTFQDGLLQSYVREVVGRFKDDTRVLFWDVYNEPGRGFYHDLVNKTAYSSRLLSKVFDWVRLIGPSQPLTSGVYRHLEGGALDAIQAIQVARSDFLSFHQYHSLQGQLGTYTDGALRYLDQHDFMHCYRELMQFGRPVFLTEFLARTHNSTFQKILPMAKERWVGALNWGWVAGKAQSLLDWDSWYKGYTRLPQIWFQDVLYPNGTAYDPAEVEFLRDILASTSLRPTRVSPRVADIDLPALAKRSLLLV